MYYHFVISHAGEDGESANRLYKALVDNGVRVFYAPQNKAQLWGENLYEYLADIYSKQGIYCLVLVSQHYVGKEWTRHEWKNAQERALSEIDQAYVLPIRLDDTELPGLPKNIGYIDAREHSMEEIATLAIEKLRTRSHQQRIKKLQSAFQELEEKVKKLQASTHLGDFDNE